MLPRAFLLNKLHVYSFVNANGDGISKNLPRNMTDGGIPRVADCLVRNLYRAATGHLELSGEQGLIAAQSSDFALNGFTVQRAIRAIVMSEAFRIVGLPE